MTHGPPALERPRRPHRGWGTRAQLWIFRHGEVAPQFQGLAYGGMDVPLSESGQRESLALAARFAAVPFRAVVASTLVRARTLGAALAHSSGAPLETSPGLVEIFRGRFQGRPMKELLARHESELAAIYDDPWNYRAHGGETDADVLARAWPVLESALARHGGPLAIACHYNVVRNLVAHALGLEPHASFRLRVDLTAGVLLEDAPGGWRLLRANVRSPGRARAATN
ncbi:MAG: histidine phosphatase family protein [Planctomycetes bacterium]|nr:histidine phosphatase family protein [Planctomycetota bacterium]